MHLALLACSVLAAIGSPLTESNEDRWDQKLLNTRRALLSRLDQCTLWRTELDQEIRAHLHSMLMNGNFEHFRNGAMKIAKEKYPDDVDCLRSVSYLIKKHNRILTEQRRSVGNDANHLEDYLTPRQINELFGIYKKLGRKEEITTALNRYFDGLPEAQKNRLVEEFFNYKTDLRRRPRKVDDISDSESNEEESSEPQQLKDDWLLWMNPRQKSIIARLKALGADKWEVMNTIADQFYHQRKEVRRKYDRQFQTYCSSILMKLLGKENFDSLQNMYLDNDPVDQIETRFHEMVGDLKNENSRLLADHYGAFCRKIYRLVHFEPTDLTSWLSKDQKIQLGKMIQNLEIRDQQVYEKVYEFFEQAEGEQKEEASDTIDTGCRHFIAHMFGDDTAEELEDLRLQGNVSTQILAARLARHAQEISSEKLRKRAESSLPMCTRIYLGYTGSCECNGHSETCDAQHSCTNCTGGTFGVQCELCLDGFTLINDECSLVEEANEEESAPCNCNQHSETCDAEGKCTRCDHNTEGDACERCAAGFYGDATKGSQDDCSPCPCPEGVACYVNENALVQCASCPAGKKGFTCDDSSENSSEEQQDKQSF